MTVTTEFITTAILHDIYVRLKAAMAGLDKLGDADVASYLNAHPSVIDRSPWMPTMFTAAMITEARAAKI